MLLPVKISLYFLLFITISVRAAEPDIIVEGLPDALETNVRAFLSVAKEKCDSPEWRVKKLFKKSDDEISKALRALGYYQPKTVKQLSFDKDCWQAHFNINGGDPVLVTDINIQVIGEGESDPVFKKLLASLPIKQGDVLNHALYEKIKQDLHSLALSYGYLKNQILKKSLQVNPEKKQAVIEIIMDSGSRYQFGEITIDQDILSPDFVQRYVRLFPEDYYSSKKLAQTYNALAESIYFKNVEIEPLVDVSEDNKVPVHIHLTPAKKHDYSVGLGYDTDIGPLASIGYKNRRLNQQGHHFSLDLDVSPVLSSAEARYIIPFIQPRNDSVSIGLGYKLEQPDTFESESAKLSLQYQHLYQNGWKQVLFLDLNRETFSISGDSQETTTLLVPGARLQFTESDNALRPTNGYHLNLSITSAPEPFISDVTFIQATASAKLIKSLPWSARLITRANVGATSVSDFDKLPASYRFFAGGIETIRGYDYKQLGPKDDQGTVIGGRMLTAVSAEYEQFINDTWGVAAFVDAGNAYNMNNIDIKVGTGLGIRWVSPIGPIRLDFAIPVNDSDSSFQIHFAAGAQL